MKEKLSPSDLASKHITLDFPVFSENTLVHEIKKHILDYPAAYKKIEYIYFTDNEKHLIGVISLHELLELPDEANIKDYFRKDVIYCRADTTLEKAVLKALHSNITSLPVVDENKRLVGILASDTLLHVEANIIESVAHHHSGLFHKSLYDLAIKGSIPKIIMARIPWLIIGSIGGMIAAGFLGFFKTTLEQNITLALFIPVVVYMGAATATQTEALFIRAIALDESTKPSSFLIRDSLVTSLLGIIIGTLLGLAVIIWKHDMLVASVIGITMFINVTVASPIAITIPTLLRKIKRDPAIGTGPLATIIQDMLSLIVYFTVASLIL